MIFIASSSAAAIRSRICANLARNLKLNNHVELTGYVSDEELQANSGGGGYLHGSRIRRVRSTTFPRGSRSWNTWPYAKPIVSFDLKETRYSAQDAAVYVPCNDELAFAKATAAADG